MIVTVKTAGLSHRMGKLFDTRRELERRIGDEMKRPAPDMFRLQSLKRLRLNAKDEIAAIRKRIRVNGPAAQREFTA